MCHKSAVVPYMATAKLNLSSECNDMKYSSQF